MPPILLAQPKQEKIYQGIELDEVMIREVRKGFDFQSFIDRVKKDTTFYKAFKSLRLMNFSMFNQIEVLDKKDEVKASFNSITQQVRKGNCRKMIVKSEKTTGDFYTKKKDYKYYTAKLYAHLFFTKDEVCNETNIVGDKIYSGSQKYEEQLRILIFNPGKKIKGIPGIGDNVAIFDKPTIDKYKFKLSRREYNNEDCYIFTAVPKPEYKKDVVINELSTWFRVSDYTIVARNYSLSLKTLFYDFDVDMKVKLKTAGKYLVPYEINYHGNWHIATKPRENVNFVAIFTDFQ
ncbi:MAG: hypothetical protein IT215_06870 [Chitinophagaceae bacterium]|nr:hypothetical protein [Chitinophagaceae bacterium]